MREVSKLQYLYLINSKDEQVRAVFGALEDADYENLQYIGVYDSTTNVTDISSINKLSDLTKSKVKYLYFYNNDIKSIEGFMDFNQVVEVNVERNANLTSLNGLNNMNLLEKLDASDCDLGRYEKYSDELENKGKNELTDSLVSLKGKKNMNIIRLRNNVNLKWVDYLSDFPLKMKVIALDNCKSLVGTSLRKIADIYLSSTSHSVGEEFDKYLYDDERIDYKSQGLNDYSEEIDTLYNNEELKALRLDGNPDLTNNKIDDVLSTCPNIEILSLRDLTNLTSIDFISNMANIKELDLIGCNNLNDLSLLETLTNKGSIALATLRIDNVEIDLSKIQNVISKLKQTYNNSLSFLSSWQAASGFVAPPSVWNNLGNCDDLSFVCGTYFAAWRDFNNTSIDLSDCKKLTQIVLGYPLNLDMTLPDSLTSFSFSAGSISNLTFTENSNLLNLTISGEGKMSQDQLTNLFSCLANCKKLTTFKFNEGSDWSNDVNSVSGIENLSSTLETLELKNNKKLTSVAGIEKFVNLTSLDLSNCRISSIDNLKVKRAADGNISEGLSKLTVLHLENNNLNDVSSISENVNLTTLYLNNNRINDLRFLEKMTNLSYLNLESNIIENNFYYQDEGTAKSFDNLEILARLNNSGKLKKLYLKENNITNFDKISSLSWDGKSGF